MKKQKSLPLIEGKTKSNTKKYNGLGRQAPPPPPPPRNIKFNALQRTSVNTVKEYETYE